MGVLVWPMVNYEADDALASTAYEASKDDRVRQILICTPDKDLSQCVVGTRVVQLDQATTKSNKHPTTQSFGAESWRVNPSEWTNNWLNIESDSFFENRKANRLYLVNQTGD